MQASPEKLDWVFTSSSWTLSFPNTKVLPLARPISDHIPYVTQISTHIPKSSIFRFGNIFIEFEGFVDVVKVR
jgi:hypothetical protein